MDPKDYLDKQTLDGLNEEEPSNRALAEGIKFIIRKLWSEKELNTIIDARHRELCEQCPIRKSVSAPVPVPGITDDEGCEQEEKAGKATAIVLAIIKSQWFWIPVATVCAILCAKYGISLPMVGGGN